MEQSGMKALSIWGKKHNSYMTPSACHGLSPYTFLTRSPPRKRWGENWKGKTEKICGLTRYELGGTKESKRQGKTRAPFSSDKDITYLICCQECIEVRVLFQTLLQFGSLFLAAYIRYERKTWTKPVVKRKWAKLSISCVYDPGPHY